MRQRESLAQHLDAGCCVATAKHRQVEAAREPAFAPREHDRCLRGIRLIERGVDLGEHRQRQRVDLAVIERDRRDSSFQFVRHKVGHENLFHQWGQGVWEILNCGRWQRNGHGST
jgi:hypothetical protein